MLFSDFGTCQPRATPAAPKRGAQEALNQLEPSVHLECAQSIFSLSMSGETQKHALPGDSTSILYGEQ